MRVLVIDNEKNIREGVVHMVHEYCPEVTEVNEASGVKSGLDAIKNLSPDIVLLDVEMDDGTGMDLLSQLSEINFELIFITAHNKYAVDAFKYSAIDFLTKPILPDDLISAMDRAANHKESLSLVKQLKVLDNSLNRLNSKEKKIVLKDSNSIYFVDVSDIIRCQSDGQYTEFYLENQKKVVISRSLKEYEELLTPFGFLRPHHSHLINVNKILRFDKADGGNLILQNQDEIPVSQRKKAAILQLLENL
jgi:two-component system LytT family response regulator